MHCMEQRTTEKYVNNMTEEVSTAEIRNSLFIIENRMERDKKAIARLKKILAMRGEISYSEMNE